MITVETLGSSSKGNCYRLLSGGRSILLECGLPWKEIRKKLNFQTTDLDGCLVSHSHGDHARSIDEAMKAGIDVYATDETFVGMDIPVENHRSKSINPGQHFHVTRHWAVLPFETVHDTPGSVGFVIKDADDTLIFLTDTAYCKYMFPGWPTIIMIEANFSESILQQNVDDGAIDPARAKRVRENHMSIERVIDFLSVNDLSRCREIRLIHLSDGNSDAELFKRMVQECTGVPTYVEG